MASPPDSRSGAGGKMVTNRRRQRLAATPYDRPLPSPSLKSPNWLTGVVIPSARALASGAGKFISSAIFSDSESSSSEDFDSASEDGADNINEYESPRDGVNALNEEKLTGGEMKEYGRESQLSMQRSETKWLIEQLIMQENFSREECDRLTKVLHSRVNHWSVETGDKRSIANSPRKTDEEDPYILNKAVQEARNWFQEKKGGSSSVAEFAHGTCNLNSAAIDHMEIGAGSPVDMARSYMKERPPWASPTEHVELRTPLTTTMKLFKERTPYSVTEDILSSSQRRSSLASESWNIQEELRKVRSKAVEDMLRTPPAKYDSSFSIAATKEESMGAGGVGEEIFKSHFFWKTKPIDAFMDVGVNADPALVALESRQDAKGSETPSSHPDASASEIIKDPETIPNDGVHAPSKLSHPTSPVHTDQHSADPHAAKIGGPPETGVAEPGGSPCTNGFTPAQASSPEAVGAQNSKQYDVENHNDAASNKNMPTNGTTNMDGNCELLTEADMEVPTVTETESINSGSHISVDMQNEESQLETTQPSAEEKPEVVMTAKQQAKKVGRTTRRSNRTKGK
ncbi:protein KAKU4-like isoform X1 [Salvia hispanica]|uniref:protein KAKU4-like isoform X1 n=1 Tax=Salvia hispanica TaxID=49212 RepID=UPI0020096552|nr:protein KAKU4-like isoform X1 [Salvia hispanica]